MEEVFRQIGKMYPNGTIEWRDILGPGDPWDTYEGRHRESQDYIYQLRLSGVPDADNLLLRFVSREKHITYTEVEEIDDSNPPEQEYTPEVYELPSVYVPPEGTPPEGP